MHLHYTTTAENIRLLAVNIISVMLTLPQAVLEKTGKMTPSRHFKKTTLRQDFGTTPFSVKTKNSSFAVNSITNL